ncbi:26068_t:CDS:2 [Dentiscutata erythropus]|uniref:26068_t:CDS:1 n=1 Tax=Dentiscutata erythropus TaxID=1348616 RepID=A0A9N9C137_9GLOM|nr:26068_t:CDS:2 [Dentiscutata erythropus]
MQQKQQNNRNEKLSIITEYNQNPIEIEINQESNSLYLKPITNRLGTPGAQWNDFNLKTPNENKPNPKLEKANLIKTDKKTSDGKNQYFQY